MQLVIIPPCRKVSQRQCPYCYSVGLTSLSETGEEEQVMGSYAHVRVPY